MGVIFAIDPGTTRSAYVLWDGSAITGMAIEPNPVLLADIRRLANWDVTLVLEMVEGRGMPVGQETFTTCVWSGRFLQAFLADDPERSHHLIYRREVKLQLCGSARAKDPNVRQALLDRLGKDACRGVAKDLWAALALVVTHEDMVRDGRW